jgi:AcrR family transcriptional regulator
VTYTEGARRRRVPALAPDDRRAALIAATIPLVREHGLAVSTKQIAHAAGVAEGTIFGVFPDKNTLLVAALVRALDPRPTLDAMAAIGADLGLRERLTAAAELINQRFQVNAELMIAARKLAFGSGSYPEAAAYMAASREHLLTALTAVIEPDAAMLRRPAAEAAGLLLLFCGAAIHGPWGDPDRFSGDAMVSLLLDGLLVRTDHINGGPERC